MGSVDWAVIVAVVAALISFGAILAQYTLLPKPLLRVERVHLKDGQIHAEVVNRGNAPAYDVKVLWKISNIAESDDRKPFAHMYTRSASDLLDVTERLSFGMGRKGDKHVIQLTWRQPPLMARLRKSRARTLEPRFRTTTEVGPDGQQQIHISGMRRIRRQAHGLER